MIRKSCNIYLNTLLNKNVDAGTQSQLVYLPATNKWLSYPFLLNGPLEMWFWLQICKIQIQLGDWYLEHSGKYHWRHNECDDVSNHQPHDCLFNRLFRRRSKETSKLRVTGLCAGNSPVTGEFTAQMASYAEMFPFDDVIILSWIERQRALLMVNRQCFLLLPQNSRTIASLSPNWSYT